MSNLELEEVDIAENGEEGARLQPLERRARTARGIRRTPTHDWLFVGMLIGAATAVIVVVVAWRFITGLLS